jgi:Na+/proline symporter
MLTFTVFDWLIVISIPVVCLILGYRRSSPTGWVDYFLARGKISSRGTLSNYIGANLVFTAIFLVLTLEGTRRGWWVLAVPGAWVIGTVVLIVLYPKMVPYLERGETLHQALGKVYDRDQSDWGTVRRWASLWTIVAFVGGVALEFYGGVLLLDWVGVPQVYKETLAAILAFVCASFTIIGGLRGVAKVNFFLDIVSFVGIITLFIFIHLLVRAGGASPSAQSGSSLPTTLGDNITFAVAALFIFVPMQLCALDTWQRGVAWTERKRVAGPLIFGAACVCYAAYVAISAGNYVREKGIAIEGVHPLLALMKSLSVPSPLIGIIVAGFIATILSTADELLNCCGYAVLADFLNLPRTEVTEEVSSRYIRSGKFYTGLFGFVAAGLAIGGIRLQKEISDMANVAFATQVVFLLPILFAFYSKRAVRLHLGALLAMLVAFVISLGLTIVAWTRGPSGRILIDSAPLLAFAGAAISMCIGWALRRFRG